MKNPTMTKEIVNGNQPLIKEILQAAEQAGNPVVSLVVSFEEGNNNPVMEFVTKNAIDMGTQQANIIAAREDKAKASANVDVDIEQVVTKAHVHGDAKISEKEQEAVVAQVTQAPKEEITLVPVKDTKDLDITINPETHEITVPLAAAEKSADGSLAIANVLIRPDKITAQEVAGLHEMEKNGLFGEQGQERLNLVMQEVYKLRPDLAPTQKQEEHQLVQAQKSAQMPTGGRETNWTEVVKADKGAREATGRML